MLIYVCSSSHGFGHAARDAAVLQQLHRLRPDWRLVISSMVPKAFLIDLLGFDAVEVRPCRWDVGMVQADALGSDPPRTLDALAELETQLPVQLSDEADWIRAQGLPVLVIGDIPPAAADLADRVDAPLVWIGNFGWDEIYAPFGGAFLAHAESARHRYGRGNLLLRCPFDLAMDWGIPQDQLPLVCSEPRGLPPSLREQLRSIEKPLVMLSFGGMGLEVDPGLFRRWPSHHFLMASAVGGADQKQLDQLDNVAILPQGVRPLDVFPFCDRHIGKPGFSTFCEAMSLKVGLHVVERQDFAEVNALMDGLQRHSRHRVLSRDAFMTGDWKLDRPLHPPSSSSLESDGAQRAAQIILSFCGQI